MIKVATLVLIVIQASLVLGLGERLLFSTTTTASPSTSTVFYSSTVELKLYNLDDGTLMHSVDLTDKFRFSVLYDNRQGAVSVSPDGFFCMFGYNITAGLNVNSSIPRMILYGPMPLDVATISVLQLNSNVTGIPSACLAMQNGIYTTDTQRGISFFKHSDQTTVQILNDWTRTVLSIYQYQLYSSGDDSKVIAVGTGIPTELVTTTTVLATTGPGFGFKVLDVDYNVDGVDVIFGTSIGSINRYQKASNDAPFEYKFPVVTLSYLGPYFAIDAGFNSSHINLFAATHSNQTSRILRWVLSPSGSVSLGSFIPTTLYTFPFQTQVAGLGLWWEPVVGGITTGITTKSVTTGRITTGLLTTGLLTTGITTSQTTGITTSRTTGITTGHTTGVTTGLITTGQITTGQITTGVTTRLITTGKPFCTATPQSSFFGEAYCTYPPSNDYVCVNVGNLFVNYPGRNAVIEKTCGIRDCSGLDRNTCNKVKNTNAALCYFPTDRLVCYLNQACPGGIPAAWNGRCDRFYDIGFATANCVTRDTASILVPANAASVPSNPTKVCAASK